MKHFSAFPAIIGVLLLTSVPASGRIGESVQQCDARYGKPTFSTVKGDLESRFYFVGGRNVQVVFHTSESVIEYFNSGTKTVSGTQAVKAFSSDWLLFFKTLLSKAYGFTDSQINPLITVQSVGSGKLKGEDIDNGKVFATCVFTTHEDNSTVKFAGTVAALEAKHASKDDLERAMNFQVESLSLAFKKIQDHHSAGF